MRRIRTTLLVSVVLLVAAGSLAGFWGWREYVSPGPLQQQTLVLVPKGTGVGALAGLLEEKGVIRDRRMLTAALRIRSLIGRDNVPKAGEYAFPPGESLRDVLARVVGHDIVVRAFTAPEGLRSAEIWALLNNEPGLTGELGPPPPEGTLLPDTYHYSHGDERGAVAQRMQAAMTRLSQQLWPDRADDLPFNSWDEAVVLASIVEKETGLAAERARVAAVFVNRLRIGMALQSDPTVIYAVTGPEGTLNRPLTRKDLAVDSPYNTYRVGGLPPGPIANPGRAALAAVLHPARTEELYFVADGSGGHAFAATLAEHNRNVAKWRALRAAQRNAR